MVWDPSQPWPGTPGGASSPHWGGYVRLYVLAALQAGNTFHVGPHQFARLDAGNVLGSGGTTRAVDRLWADLSCDVIDVEVVAGATGGAGILTQSEAATCQVSLADPDGIYDPTNPDSPWVLGARSRLVPGVPVEVYAEVVDPGSDLTALVLSGATGSRVWVPSAEVPVDGPSGDFTIRAKIRTPATFTNAYLFSNYDPFALANGGVGLQWDATGKPIVRWSTGTVQQNAVCPVALPASTTLELEVEVDVDNGAGGRTVTFRTSIDDGATWQPLGAPLTTAGVGTVKVGVAAPHIGSDAYAGNRYAGTVWRVRVWGGRPSTTLVPIYAALFDEATAGVRTVVDAAQGFAWRLDTAANVAVVGTVPPAVSTHYLFTGTADSWGEDWTPTPSKRKATLVATDATKQWVRYNRPEQVPQGAGDTTAQRIARLVEFYDWPGTVIDAPSSTVTLQATTLAKSGWELLGRTLDDELGVVYFTPRGELRWTNRAAWFELPDPIVELGCQTVETGLHDVITDASPSNLDANVKNIVRAARTGGEIQTAQSGASIEQFGPYEFQRTDLGVETDPQAAQWATDVLTVSAYPRVVLRDVTLRPGISPTSWDLWPLILDVEYVTDVARIVWAPPDRPTAVVEAAARPVGSSHKITRGAWVVEWQLAMADVQSGASIFTIGPHVSDRLDAGNVLAYA